MLAQLKGNAETALGGRSVLSAVVGVPVNATPGMRAALTAASTRAGLQKIELLSEPVAAAIAALRELPEVATARTLGVYALGGRSFSFSVLRRLEAAPNPNSNPNPNPSPSPDPTLTPTPTPTLTPTLAQAGGGQQGAAAT